MTRLISGLGLVALTMGAVACGNGAVRDRADLVAMPVSCGPTRFEVYFDEGQARLTEPARQAIGLTATQLQGCEIRKVSVLGLADASGGSDANMTLSQRRAQTVADAFAAAGWPTPAFEISAGGDAGARMGTGVQEPLRRRTEVLVDAVAR